MLSGGYFFIYFVNVYLRNIFIHNFLPKTLEFQRFPGFLTEYSMSKLATCYPLIQNVIIGKNG